MTLPHEFIFVFIWYFNAVILSEKSYKNWGVRKKYKKGGWPYRGIVYRRRVQTFCTLWKFFSNLFFTDIDFCKPKVMLDLDINLNLYLLILLRAAY